MLSILLRHLGYLKIFAKKTFAWKHHFFTFDDLWVLNCIPEVKYHRQCCQKEFTWLSDVFKLFLAAIVPEMMELCWIDVRGSRNMENWPFLTQFWHSKKKTEYFLKNSSRLIEPVDCFLLRCLVFDIHGATFLPPAVWRWFRLRAMRGLVVLRCVALFGLLDWLFVTMLVLPRKLFSQHRKIESATCLVFPRS